MKKNLTAIAKELGVSPSTVSKVINNRSGVSDELRSRINAYLDGISFQPNAIAQSMITGHTNIIGLIVGDLRNPFYSDLANAIQHQLEEKGYMLMVYGCDYNADKAGAFIRRAIQYKFAGLLLVSSYAQSLLQSINEARREGISVVLVNRNIEGFDGSFVSLDNFQAGYIAAKHLLDIGHQDITLFSGPMNSSATVLRQRGFYQALENFGLSASLSGRIIEGSLTIESGCEMAKQFFEREGRRSTAVVAGNDLIALGFMDYCARTGIRIPEDVSLVSFDNTIFSSLYGISLTTVDQDVGDMSRKAVDYILEDIENPENSIVRRELIEPKLVVRSTTAPLLPTD